MSKSEKTKDHEQYAKFREAARELGADEDEARFDAALKKVASAQPPKNAHNPKPKKKPAE